MLFFLFRVYFPKKTAAPCIIEQNRIENRTQFERSLRGHYGKLTGRYITCNYIDILQIIVISFLRASL